MDNAEWKSNMEDMQEGCLSSKKKKSVAGQFAAVKYRSETEATDELVRLRRRIHPTWSWRTTQVFQNSKKKNLIWKSVEIEDFSTLLRFSSPAPCFWPLLSETYCWTKKLNREDYGVDKYWVFFFSRLRFEISRLRLRFLAGWDLPMTKGLDAINSTHFKNMYDPDNFLDKKS